MDEDTNRKVTCEICGKQHKLFQKVATWVDYLDKIQCLDHCPEAIEYTNKSGKIIHQLLCYNKKIDKCLATIVCPECGKTFKKKRKEQVTCGLSCSNKYFPRKSFCYTKKLSEDEIKEVEDFEKDLEEI